MCDVYPFLGKYSLDVQLVQFLLGFNWIPPPQNSYVAVLTPQDLRMGPYLENEPLQM